VPSVISVSCEEAISYSKKLACLYLLAKSPLLAKDARNGALGLS
jgi:hypothetical protein